MKISDKTYIFILLVLILGLSSMSHWQFKRSGQSLIEVSLPKIEMPETRLEEFFLPENEGEQEWVSEDEKLKFSYPLSWLKIENATGNVDFLGLLNEQAASKGTEILFLAQKIDIKSSSFAFMVVQKIELAEDEEDKSSSSPFAIAWEKEKNLEEITQLLVEEIENEETNIEIIAKEITDNEAQLEIDYERAGGVLYHSIKKIILRENIVYTIEVASLKDGWQKIEKEARDIIETFQIFE